MTHTLYYSPGACSLAPHIVLEEIGVAFSLVLASTSDGTTRSPEYLRVNPKGRVPALSIGDSVITEAPAILLHLALSNPHSGLLPSIPDGLVLCHTCDNPRCVRPDHLFPGTMMDNIQDAKRKGRMASGNRSGPRLHPERMTRGDAHWSHLYPERHRGELNGRANRLFGSCRT